MGNQSKVKLDIQIKEKNYIFKFNLHQSLFIHGLTINDQWPAQVKEVYHSFMSLHEHFVLSFGSLGQSRFFKDQRDQPWLTNYGSSTELGGSGFEIF